MTYPFFAYIARMRYIGRWGLMRNTEPENTWWRCWPTPWR